MLLSMLLGAHERIQLLEQHIASLEEQILASGEADDESD